MSPADSHPPETDQLDRLAGRRIRQYELIRLLGRAGMATVYLARDLRLGRRVAIKFLREQHPLRIDRFLADARLTPDGTRLITISWDGTAQVWNLQSGTSIVLRGHTESDQNVDFHPDATALVWSLDGQATAFHRTYRHPVVSGVQPRRHPGGNCIGRQNSAHMARRWHWRASCPARPLGPGLVHRVQSRRPAGPNSPKIPRSRLAKKYRARGHFVLIGDESAPPGATRRQRGFPPFAGHRRGQRATLGRIESRSPRNRCVNERLR